MSLSALARQSADEIALKSYLYKYISVNKIDSIKIGFILKIHNMISVMIGYRKGIQDQNCIISKKVKNQYDTISKNIAIQYRKTTR